MIYRSRYISGFEKCQKSFSLSITQLMSHAIQPCTRRYNFERLPQIYVSSFNKVRVHCLRGRSGLYQDISTLRHWHDFHENDSQITKRRCKLSFAHVGESTLRNSLQSHMQQDALWSFFDCPLFSLLSPILMILWSDYQKAPI